MKGFSYALVVLLSSVLFISSCHDEEVTKKETRLDHYVEVFDIDDLGFEPMFEVKYDYSASGALRKYTLRTFDPSTGQMELQRYMVFVYSGDKVEHISGYLKEAIEPYVEYSYQYTPNGDVSKITESNHSSRINSEVNFSYAANGVVTASYVFSNGGNFAYEFDYASKNILRDKTTRGAQLCSDGEYTYDQHHNPFSELGYIDYTLTNLSQNNRLTENVNYVGCAFPTVIAESYAYEYNDRGYPTSATTFYKSQGNVKKSRREFFYK